MRREAPSDSVIRGPACVSCVHLRYAYLECSVDAAMIDPTVLSPPCMANDVVTGKSDRRLCLILLPVRHLRDFDRICGNVRRCLLQALLCLAKSMAPELPIGATLRGQLPSFAIIFCSQISRRYSDSRTDTAAVPTVRLSQQSLNANVTEIDSPPIHVPVHPRHECVLAVRIAPDQNPVMQNV